MKLKLMLVFVIAVMAVTARAQQDFPFDNEISEFKHQDSLNMPAKNGILFIGSSSIRKWTDLEQRFSAQPIIRRGVGGCELWQIVDFYTPYILFPYHPRKIFIYAGENDIAGGKSGRFVAAEFVKLWRMIVKQLPGADVYFMAIKPSPSRARFLTEMNAANTMIGAFISSKRKGHYIDVATVILNSKTMQPDSTLFEQDYLHLNSKGYDKWQAVLQPYVK